MGRPVPSVLLRSRSWASSARLLAFHSGPQNAIDARLIASAVGLQPPKHVRIEADCQLLFGGRPCFRCPFEKSIVERRDIRIVDVGILHAVNSRQIAFDRFLLMSICLSHGDDARHLAGARRVSNDDYSTGEQA
jgi:hypothetical protein